LKARFSSLLCCQRLDKSPRKRAFFVWAAIHSQALVIAMRVTSAIQGVPHAMFSGRLSGRATLFILVILPRQTRERADTTDEDCVMSPPNVSGLPSAVTVDFKALESQDAKPAPKKPESGYSPTPGYSPESFFLRKAKAEGASEPMLMAVTP
jgi:hypothetical protein